MENYENSVESRDDNVEFRLSDAQLEIMEKLKPTSLSDKDWTLGIGTLNAILYPGSNSHDKSKLLLSWASIYGGMAARVRTEKCPPLHQETDSPRITTITDKSNDFTKNQVGTILRPDYISETEWQALIYNLEALLAITQSIRDKFLLVEGFKVLQGIDS